MSPAPASACPYPSPPPCVESANLPADPPTARSYHVCQGLKEYFNGLLIDEVRPWITPGYVIGTAFDGKRGYFIRRADVCAFLEVHPDTPVVFHNAPFDLSVI